MDQPVDIHFPKAGIDNAIAYGKQPARRARDGTYVRTTHSAVNVRSFEPSSGRDRGGSRAGLVKHVPTTVAGTTWVVQSLGVLASTDPGVPAVQQSLSGRVVFLIAVSQGKVFVKTPDDTSWTATVNTSGEEPELNFTGLVRSTSLLQKQYFCDGTNYVWYDPPSNTVKLWAATAGTLPEDSDENRARLICTWRGRIVLSGLIGDPQNWFMSKVDDAFNFEYGPSPTTATDAVAGNNSPLGQIGDVINGLVPWTDDVLIFLGDHSIWAMRGDPAAGGQVDMISDITGGAFGNAWCKDPYGNIYFFGSRPSIWRMQGASQPERISQPIEPLIADLNTGTTLISMVWDDAEQSVHLYLTPDDEPTATRHLCWEMRSNSWVEDVFANDDHNPLCVVAYDGNDANDRVVLLGCWDGFVRAIDVDATTDDGTLISSSVLIGPIMTPTMEDVVLKEVQGVLGDESGDVTFEILSGDTAESALAAAPSESGAFSAGRSQTQPIRVAGHAIYVRLTSTNRWAMEAVRAVFGSRGKVRARRPGVAPS